MRVREDYRSITGQEKAAIFLMSLSQDQASKIFANLDDEEIKEISQSMSGLGTVSSEVIERLFVEFAEQVSSTGSLIGSADSAQRLLGNILGEEKVGEIMEEIRGPAGRTMWDKLANVNEQVLANYLKNEYPQTVAVILAKIGQVHAAKVLATLPENFSLEVVMRMLRMEAVDKEVEKDVERVLRTEFMSNLARSNQRDTFELMADIFNNFDRTTETRFLSALDERSKDSAEKIRALMFTFDDLIKLDAAGVQTLMRTVEKDKMTMALKGGSDEMKELFFSNMSERASKLMKEDMTAMGPVRLSEVEQAQLVMVQATKDLIDRGEIVMTSSDGGAAEQVLATQRRRCDHPRVRARVFAAHLHQRPLTIRHQVAAGIDLVRIAAIKQRDMWHVAVDQPARRRPEVLALGRESCAHRKAPPGPAPSDIDGAGRIETRRIDGLVSAIFAPLSKT